MTPAQFIDVYLTPLGGGLGAFIGMTWGARKRPAKNEQIVPLRNRILLAALVAAGLLALELFF